MKLLRLFLLGLLVAFNVMAQQKLPNILWITSEDNGPELGCYGDKYSKSPNLDGLAAGGDVSELLVHRTCLRTGTHHAD